MLPRQHRLRSSRSFRQVYEQGRSWANPLAVLYARAQPSPEKRIGVSSSRRIGGAVARHRVRRRLMAACRELEPRIRPGVHLVVIARPAAAGATYGELRAALEELLQRAGALGSG